MKGCKREWKRERNWVLIEKREVAKRMLAKGLEASLVAELTGLNLKDVRCLVPLCDGLD